MPADPSLGILVLTADQSVARAGFGAEREGRKGTVSATEVVLAVGIIAYVIFRQVRGETLRARRTVLLPAVLTVMGYTDLHLTGGHLQAVDLTCLAVGAAGSALVGCAFGVVMRLEQREGYLWARLPVRGLWLWVALVVWRLAMTGVAHAAHAHVAASSSTLLFSLGLNRLAPIITYLSLLVRKVFSVRFLVFSSFWSIRAYHFIIPNVLP